MRITRLVVALAVGFMMSACGKEGSISSIDLEPMYLCSEINPEPRAVQVRMITQAARTIERELDSETQINRYFKNYLMVDHRDHSPRFLDAVRAHCERRKSDDINTAIFTSVETAFEKDKNNIDYMSCSDLTPARQEELVAAIEKDGAAEVIGSRTEELKLDLSQFCKENPNKVLGGIKSAVQENRRKEAAIQTHQNGVAEHNRKWLEDQMRITAEFENSIVVNGDVSCDRLREQERSTYTENITEDQAARRRSGMQKTFDALVASLPYNQEHRDLIDSGKVNLWELTSNCFEESARNVLAHELDRDKRARDREEVSRVNAELYEQKLERDRQMKLQYQQR